MTKLSRFSQIITVTFIILGAVFSASAQAANSTPTAGTITPSSGQSIYGTEASFTTTYQDANGASDILHTHLLINAETGGKNRFYGYYNLQENKFYISNDAATAWLGGYAPGTNNTIENSYVKLVCSRSNAQSSGNTLTVKWTIVFKNAFTSVPLKTYLFIRDKQQANSGWVNKGTWRVVTNSTPTVGTITPNQGESIYGNEVNFTTTYQDANGVSDILHTHLLINKNLDGRNALYGYYNPQENKFYLCNDAATAWLGGYAPGSNNTIENSYVKLLCAKSSAQTSGNILTVKWTVIFKNTFINLSLKSYLFVRDKQQAVSNWQYKGTWSVASPPQWQIEYIHLGGEHSLSLDSLGRPHIAFEIDYGDTYKDSFISYAYKDEARGWIIEYVEHLMLADAGLSLRMDSQDRPHIGYSEEWGTGIYYTVKTEEGWQKEDVRGSWTWNDVSLGLDKEDRPHLICGDNSDRTLRHYFKKDLEWKYDIIAGEEQAWYVCNVPIVIDSAGKFHIVFPYYSSYAGATYYAYQATTGWKVESLTPQLDISKQALAIDNEDNLHLVGITFEKQVMYGLKNNLEWSFTNLTAASGDQLSSAAIALDSHGKPHIIYVNRTQKKVEYIWRDSLRWHYQTIFYNTNPTQELSNNPVYITLDKSDKPHITFNLINKATDGPA